MPSTAQLRSSIALAYGAPLSTYSCSGRPRRTIAARSTSWPARVFSSAVQRPCTSSREWSSTSTNSLARLEPATLGQILLVNSATRRTRHGLVLPVDLVGARDGRIVLRSTFPVSGRRMECVMSMQPQPWPQPAQEIVVAVRAMYARRRAPLAVQVRDQLGELFADAQFVGAFGVRGKPGWSPGRLALVTVLQMAEALSDRQAAEAVGDKLSWKYALGLGLEDPGFDASVLSEFRTRVVQHGLEERVLDLLLVALKDKGLVRAGGRQRTDSTHVVAAVRDLNRLELAGESVRACVEALAVAAPGWLAATFDVSGWGRRYGRRIDSWRLPTSQVKRAELAVAYGQ